MNNSYAIFRRVIEQTTPLYQSLYINDLCSDRFRNRLFWTVGARSFALGERVSRRKTIIQHRTTRGKTDLENGYFSSESCWKRLRPRRPVTVVGRSMHHNSDGGGGGGGVSRDRGNTRFCFSSYKCERGGWCNLTLDLLFVTKCCFKKQTDRMKLVISIFIPLSNDI